jgi:CxxC motif-containing protein
MHLSLQERLLGMPVLIACSRCRYRKWRLDEPIPTEHGWLQLLEPSEPRTVKKGPKNPIKVPKKVTKKSTKKVTKKSTKKVTKKSTKKITKKVPKKLLKKVPKKLLKKVLKRGKVFLKIGAQNRPKVPKVQ